MDADTLSDAAENQSDGCEFEDAEIGVIVAPTADCAGSSEGVRRRRITAAVSAIVGASRPDWFTHTQPYFDCSCATCFQRFPPDIWSVVFATFNSAETMGLLIRLSRVCKLFNALAKTQLRVIALRYSGDLSPDRIHAFFLPCRTMTRKFIPRCIERGNIAPLAHLFTRSRDARHRIVELARDPSMPSAIIALCDQHLEWRVFLRYVIHYSRCSIAMKVAWIRLIPAQSCATWRGVDLGCEHTEEMMRALMDVGVHPTLFRYYETTRCLRYNAAAATPRFIDMLVTAYVGPQTQLCPFDIFTWICSLGTPTSNIVPAFKVNLDFHFQRFAFSSRDLVVLTVVS